MTSPDSPPAWKTRSGRTVTEADAERMAAEFEQENLDFTDAEYPRRRGRPSLTGRAERSPQITFRLEDELLQRASHVAQREGVTLSSLARQALDAYVRSQP